MGSTRRNQSNETNQIDSRQVNDTVNNIDIERRIEDAFNTAVDVEDNSQGNITAGGDVTVQSEVSSIAASEAATATVEAATQLQADLAAEQRRTAEINAQIEQERVENNRRIAEANATAQERLAEEQRRVTEASLDSNEAVSIASITATNRASERATQAIVDVSEEALFRNGQYIQNVLDGGKDNLSEALDFLEQGDAEDRKLLESGFGFLGSTIEDANTLSTKALSEAFKSTVGGVADSQQKTLLIGLASLAALVLFLALRKSL